MAIKMPLLTKKSVHAAPNFRSLALLVTVKLSYFTGKKTVKNPLFLPQTYFTGKFTSLDDDDD